MSDPFLSSDDYGERAHQLYNEGRYDEAVEVLRDGLEVYPFGVELHVGLAYARLAREEFAWARGSFEHAQGLDPDHEDALAGLGETLLKFGNPDRALKCFDQVLALGFREDHDLVLQMGRALFREGLIEPARAFFELAVEHHGESSEAAACLGYAQHRLGDEPVALHVREQTTNVLLGALQYEGDPSRVDTAELSREFFPFVETSQGGQNRSAEFGVGTVYSW